MRLDGLAEKNSIKSSDVSIWSQRTSGTDLGEDDTSKRIRQFSDSEDTSN